MEKNEKAEEQRNGGRTGEETGKVRKIIESQKEIKIGHNNKKFMALSPPFRPNPLGLERQVGRCGKQRSMKMFENGRKKRVRKRTD